MKSLLVCLAVFSVASIADAQQYRGGYGRTGSHSAMTRQYRPAPRYNQPQQYGNYQPQPIYRPQRQLYQPLLYGYGYGPNIYGDYSSAFHPSPVFQQNLVADPYYYGW